MLLGKIIKSIESIFQYYFPIRVLVINAITGIEMTPLILCQYWVESNVYLMVIWGVFTKKYT